MNHFSLSCASYVVSKLTALAQGLITLRSPSAQSARLSRPDHPEQVYHIDMCFEFSDYLVFTE
jgi:hypothetical protein